MLEFACLSTLYGNETRLRTSLLWYTAFEFTPRKIFSADLHRPISWRTALAIKFEDSAPIITKVALKTSKPVLHSFCPHTLLHWHPSFILNSYRTVSVYPPLPPTSPSSADWNFFKRKVIGKKVKRLYNVFVIYILQIFRQNINRATKIGLSKRV
jgi:hypothetical protein